MKIREFASYEQALALKELGFNEVCSGGWDGNKKEIDSNLFKINKDAPEIHPSAPTYAQAFRFFRDKYNLYCGFIEPNTMRIRECQNTYEIVKGNSDEEAELACLKKLIELVDQNKDD